VSRREGKIYRLSGYIPYSPSDSQGFAMPLFQQGTESCWYTQVSDGLRAPTAHVVRFDVASDPVVALTSEVTVREQDRPVFVFIVRGSLVAGHLGDVRDDLERYASQDSSEPAVRLQIAELVGNQSERRRARQEMTMVIEKLSGGLTAHQFRTVSLGVSTFWQLLLEAASPGDSSDRLTAYRREIARAFRHELPLLLPVTLWAMIRSWLQSEPEALVAAYRDEMPEEGLSSVESPLDEGALPIGAALGEIGSYARQEERVAVLYRMVLESPEIGISTLSVYEDKGIFANRAAGVLRERIGRHELFGAHPEHIIAQLINKLYSMAFPNQRGLLLLFLAHHLGHYSVIRETIAARVNSSGAYAVHMYRKAIDETLERARVGGASSVDRALSSG
jgi:hypothetical protein